MAAADLKATVAALQAQLRSLKCPLRLDAGAAEAGSPAPYLQALSWLLLHFSKHVALLVTQQGLKLRGATDLRFAEGALRFARDALALRPALSAAQLLADGQFVRAKAALVLEVARACKERHNAAARQERLAALKACHAEQRLYSAAAAPAAAAPPVDPQQQQQLQVGRPAARSSCIPRPPPPHVRVVSAAAQQQEEAAAGVAAHAPSAAAAEPQEELSSEGSEGWVAADASITPTSVVAGHAAGALGKQQAACQPAAQRPDASPADQPRALPPALLAARPAEMQPAAGLQVGSAGNAQAPLPPLASFPQLLAAAPGAALPLLLPAGAMNALMSQPLAAAVPPQQMVQKQAQQVQQHQGAQEAQPSSTAVVASSISCGASSLADQQTRRLIEDLHLRLALAEETAAAARHEAQAAREQLQARVTILEGRVRFLEAGFELRPAHPQQPLLLAGAAYGQGQPQPPLALPAPAYTIATAGGGIALGAGRCSSGIGVSFGGSIGTAGGADGWRGFASSSDAACQPAQQAAQQQAQQLPWRSKQPPLLQPVPVQSAAVAATAAAGPAAAPVVSGSGSAADLIRSMQARFSEAEDFLLSLRRL